MFELLPYILIAASFCLAAVKWLEDYRHSPNTRSFGFVSLAISMIVMVLAGLATYFSGVKSEERETALNQQLVRANEKIDLVREVLQYRSIMRVDLVNQRMTIPDVEGSGTLLFGSLYCDYQLVFNGDDKNPVFQQTGDPNYNPKADSFGAIWRYTREVESLLSLTVQFRGGSNASDDRCEFHYTFVPSA